MTLQDIAAAMGASVDQDRQRVVETVRIDSRIVRPGELFFCIVGQKLDGHEFAKQAVENGACAVVASAPLELSVPVLIVRDTTLALGNLARMWRERARARVIGVSGSAGKTATASPTAAGSRARACRMTSSTAAPSLASATPSVNSRPATATSAPWPSR